MKYLDYYEQMAFEEDPDCFRKEVEARGWTNG